MVHMNHKSYIVMGAAVAIFLLALPLIFNNGLSYQYVSNSSLDRFNNYTGVTLSYYAAIFGGFVGGIFTYAGVKLSLNNQGLLVKREAEAHRNLLLLQLKISYDKISSIANVDENKLSHLDLNFLIFDKNWYEHLPYVECLGRKDLEYIVDWFYVLDLLETKSRTSPTGGTPTGEAKKYIERTEYIKPIIDKIESNTSC
ncbi:MAG: hypothetical protein A4E23_00021 [Methanomethylovorans sp. PtaU1.Bin073]|nr:MAG: hypothetical protein A4E23_00021 [Methanomethylovorans sp. PtaU1.Bin073]